MSEEIFEGIRTEAEPLIYLVDDDEDFREELIFGLTTLGLNVQGFHCAASLYRAYAAKPSDIVILDIGLDGEDGLSITAHLRASQSVGIILVTARSSTDDRIVGLRSGADAYLVKPIAVRELAATISPLAARLGKPHVPPQTSSTSQWALIEGGWVLTDGLSHRLRLTTAEHRFLGRLFAARGETVERHALVEAMGEDVYDYNHANLDTIVSRLRRRAEKSDMTLPLHAIRGIGFVFAD